MRLISYKSESGNRVGMSIGGRVLDTFAAGKDLGVELPPTSDSLFKAGEVALQGYRELSQKPADSLEPYLLELDRLSHAPTVPAPPKILCVGLNYRRHADESGMAIPAEPVLFSKFNNALIGHDCDVSITGLEQVDYETEMAVVLGRQARNVPEREALDFVLGYVVANDLSERKLQFQNGQWLLGKTLDGFLPLGPCLVTRDEVPDPQQLDVRGWLNGELRQNSSTADMIFSVAEIIAYASRYMTLWPGDVILTGTPEGVVLGMAEQQWMRPGDTFVAEVGDLGRLRNRMVD